MWGSEVQFGLIQISDWFGPIQCQQRFPFGLIQYQFTLVWKSCANSVLIQRFWTDPVLIPNCVCIVWTSRVQLTPNDPKRPPCQKFFTKKKTRYPAELTCLSDEAIALLHVWLQNKGKKLFLNKVQFLRYPFYFSWNSRHQFSKVCFCTIILLFSFITFWNQ